MHRGKMVAFEVGMVVQMCTGHGNVDTCTIYWGIVCMSEGNGRKGGYGSRNGAKMSEKGGETRGARARHAAPFQQRLHKLRCYHSYLFSTTSSFVHSPAG